MAERRSITDAVGLTPNLEAFIKTGVPAEPTSAKPSKTPLSPAAESETVVEMPFSSDSSASVASTRPRTRARRQPRTPGSPDATDTESHVASILDDILVPLTTKLRRRTVQALRRAYLEQKLSGRVPATQQEIIEDAVGEWLRRNGFDVG